MSTLLHDLRLALRSLIKRPGFSLLAIFTLGLGLGATTAIFTVVQSVLLEPLAYPQSDRLMVVMEKNPAAGFPRFSLSPLNFRDYREMNGTFESMAATTGSSLAFSPEGGGPAQRWNARSVTHDYLDVLGIVPIHGRDFYPEDDTHGASGTLILGYSQWQRLGADPDLIGKKLRIDGESSEVIGVLPRGILPDRDALVPLRIDYEQSGRGGHWLLGIGRLADGVDIETARADLENVAAALEAEYPDSNTGWGSLVFPMRELMVENVEQALWVLLIAVGVVLLIACANVANLTLTRLAERERDVAVQTALGASRWHIVRQMLIESLFVAGCAGLLGLALARFGVNAILALDADAVPRAHEVGFDGSVLAFGFLLTLFTSVLFGLVPALQAASPNLIDAIKAGGRTGASGSHRLRSSLVIAEVALALMLTIAGGLLVRSYANLLDVEPGFDPGSLWTASINLPDASYEDEDKTLFFERLVQEASAIPGVESVATVHPMPLSGGDYILTFVHEGRPIPEPNEAPNSGIRFVSGDYFATMGITVERGRPLDSSDRMDRERVLVANRSAVDAFWPDQDPIGQRLTFDDPEDEEAEWYRVVGIAGNVRHGALSGEPEPALYLSSLQAVTGRSTLVLKTGGSPEIAAKPLRQIIADLDPNLPLFREQAGAAYLGQSLAEPRFNTTLLGLFAGLALALAMVGVFGVISFTVAQQIREIGVRMALGADGSRIVSWVMLKGLQPVFWGIGLGLLGAIAATRMLQNLVFGVPTLDLGTFALVAAGLAAVALLACLIPAYRASRIEPVVVLRSE